MKKMLLVLLSLLVLVSGSALAQENVVVGRLEEAVNFSLIITRADGCTIYFVPEDDIKIDAGPDNALRLGQQVLVEYEGILTGDSRMREGIAVALTSLGSVTGVISDAAMHSLTLETAEGKSYQFKLGEEANVVLADGLAIGCEVEVAFYGALTDGGEQDAVVWEVHDAPAEQAEGPATQPGA